MKKIQRLLTSLMVFVLMVGNTGWVVAHLQEIRDSLDAPPFQNSNVSLQDPRPIGLGNGLYK